ncbi:hydrolase 1, exosortase A system-associated [Endozoicomonas sp. SM1973]|uniref:Hydrolase 1, exosortase A system-associated n=1 Tax=Spartinivicinus marinus TaxID=2994442 RepID=A0A853I2Q0_9GAMM|nr:hydrolase 1, exosortase A system-associated [Spartinivicinus marinus]MCX4024971.1 hydrolase 1, exosortase A system-associated [Spartinivicinus marinus]NYZ67663.1 hydrolase 1, exosortase A system-associated [Spartinivicinus marinus]
MNEQPVIFPCLNERLIGVIHQPTEPVDTGVLIIVGGPQMKSGSHRQFVLLARALVKQSIAVMRFDYRGMGDSTGELQGFETINDDIKAAVDEFFNQQPKLQQVVLWGLCDAASAALFYGWRDSRVKGLVLANPWVRSEAGLAQVYVKNYYWSRLFDKHFWLKAFRGQLKIKQVASDFYQNITKLIVTRKKILKGNEQEVTADKPVEPSHFIDRMRYGWDKFSGKTLLLLSGNDLTAAEFVQLTQSHPHWRQLLNKSTVTQWHCAEANHTFSTGKWRNQVEQQTVEWIINHVVGG